MASSSTGNEKQSLGSFVKKQTKYGTTTKLPIKTKSFVKHTVQSNDTLAGIALKYGVTIDEIKRVNNLWTNDSLFLREFIYIPISKNNESDLPENCQIVNGDVFKTSSTAKVNGDFSTSFDHSCSSDSTDDRLQRSVSVDTASSSTSGNFTPNTVDISAKDYLSKFDSTFAQLKTSVREMEQHSVYKDSDLMHISTQRRNTFGSPRMSASSSFTTQPVVHYQIDQSSSSPVLVIRSRTKTRQVQDTIVQIEKSNEDIFQL